jgi:hypothetical protein
LHSTGLCDEANEVSGPGFGGADADLVDGGTGVDTCLGGETVLGCP